MKIALIGDLIIDEYLTCVERFNPETDKPCYTIINKETQLGGVNNLFDVFVLNDFYIDFYCTSNEFASIKKRIIVNDKYVARIDEDKIHELSKCDIVNLKETNYDWYIISDYLKGTITKELLKNIPMEKVIVDTKPEHMAWFTGAHILKCNKKEFFSYSNKIDMKNLVITDGKDGVMVNNKFIKQLDPKEDFNVIGAGDKFMAYMCMGYFKSKDLVKAVKYANEMVVK